MSLVAVKFVRVKMLPFDNKSEFQVIVDMPEGTPLEQTDRVTQALADAIRTQPEVTTYQTYVGTSGPYNFNGLVRHYFLRQGSNVADIQVNLVEKGERKAQSHVIAKRVRDAMAPIAARFGARVKVAEVPPGPPVLETLVAEIYGPDYTRDIAIARQVRETMEQTDGVVDVDWYVEDDQPKVRFVVDEEKAALNGVSEAEIVRALRLASAGEAEGLLHAEREKEDVPVVLRLDRATRSDLDRLAEPAHHGPRGQPGQHRRARAGRDRDGGQEHLPQEPDAGRLRDRGRRGRHREPGLCDPRSSAPPSTA